MNMKKIGLFVSVVMLANTCVLADTVEEKSEFISAPIVEKAYTMAATPTITMDRTRDISDIVAMAKALPNSAFEANPLEYDVEPDVENYTEAGSIKQEYLDDALNALEMVRYVAGLPYENVQFTDLYNSYSQYGAVLMATSDQFTHYPTQPEDCPDDFFALAYKGCSEANLSWQMGSIKYASTSKDNLAYDILGWMQDEGSNNIEHAGHRRWMLIPGATNFGIGYASVVSSSYYEGYSSLHVDDGWNSGNPDTYVAWPSSGDFPIEYFTGDWSSNVTAPQYPWSINLGTAYGSPSRSSVEITLTRYRDGAVHTVWEFDENTPQLGDDNMPDNSMHLAVDDTGYGMTKAIIFRPDVTTLGTILPGDVFTVEVSGITTSAGAATTLEYEIDFFDLSDEMERSEVSIQVNDTEGNPISEAIVDINGETLTTDADGWAYVRLDNHNTYSYVIIAPNYERNTGEVTLGDEDMSTQIQLNQNPPWDISGDGYINQEDASLLAEYLSSWTMEFDDDQKECADVYDDGVINIKDAVLLAQYLAEWEV